MFNRLNVTRYTFCAAAVVACVADVVPAHAGTIAASEVSYDMALLGNFNLVTLGDYKNNSGGLQTIDGRVIVGGNLNNGFNSGTLNCVSAACTGNATVAVDATRQQYGTLTVFGNVVGPYGGIAPGYNQTTNTGTAGTTYIGGTANGYFYGAGKQNLNIRGSASGLQADYANNITTSQASFAGSVTNQTTGAKTVVGASAASVFPFTSAKLSGEIKNLAAGIAALPGTPGVTVQTLPSPTNGFISVSSKVDYTARGKNYGVITTTVSQLASASTLRIDNNGMDATLVIVTGDCPTCLLPTLNSYAGQSKVLFEFVNATALSFAGAWNASILAPLATITSMGGTIDGSVIVNSIAQSQAITANNLFAGDLTGLIPEPTSMSLFGLGAIAAGLLGRRKRKAAHQVN